MTIKELFAPSDMTVESLQELEQMLNEWERG